MSDVHHNLKKKEKVFIISHWTGFLPTSWENQFEGNFCIFSFVPHLGGGGKDEGSDWGELIWEPPCHENNLMIVYWNAKNQQIILGQNVCSDSISYPWIHFKNQTCSLPSPWVIAAVLRGSRIFAASWEKLSGRVDRSRRFGSEITWNTGSGRLYSAKFHNRIMMITYDHQHY